MLWSGEPQKKMLRAVLLVCMLSSVRFTTSDAPGSLQLLHVVFRHGARTPADTYPTDPHINQTFSPYGWGQLTNDGKQQQYQLGEWLRKRYYGFIGEYHPDVVEAWTTNVDRTKMSMQLVLAGLYPPTGKHVWNKDLLWQPIPTSYQENDKMLLVSNCPRYSEAREEIFKLPDVNSIVSTYKALYDYLSFHSGLTISDPDDVQSLYSTLKAEADFNLPSPPWVNPVFPKKLEEVTKQSFVLNAYTTELKRLKGGPLLKKVIEDTLKKAENKTPGRKLYAYAGHDSTVANFLSALNVWEPQIPEYNMMAIVEVHNIGTEYAVKVLLRRSSNGEAQTLVIPGCGVPCPMSRFLKLTEAVIPKDIETECLPKNPFYKPPADRGP